MKKTISLAALAISASTSSFAFIGPPVNVHYKTYCLEMHSDMDGSMIAGSCDMSANNATLGAQIGQNGCAEGQISLVTSKTRSEREFPVRIRSCLPPNVVQL